MYNNIVEFEFDEAKSKQNYEKHGLSLEDAKELWAVLGVVVDARMTEEVRYLRIGSIRGKFYSCIFTMREKRIRLISVRRSREEEEKIYKELIRHEKRE